MTVLKVFYPQWSPDIYKNVTQQNDIQEKDTGQNDTKHIKIKLNYLVCLTFNFFVRIIVFVF